MKTKTAEEVSGGGGGTDGKPPVSSRTFQGFDEDGLLKITAKARTMDEAIQTAYDIFGDKVTIWNFRWLS